MKELLRKNGILYSIILVASLIIVSVAFSFYSRFVMAKNLSIKSQSENITSQTYAIVSEQLQAVDQSVRAFALTKDEVHLKYMASGVDGLSNKIKKLNQLLIDQKKDLPEYAKPLDTLQLYLKETEQYIKSYYVFTNSMIELIKIDSLAEFKRLLLEDRGMIPWSSWNKLNTKTKEYETSFNLKAQNNYQQAISLNSWIQVLLLIIGLPTVIWIAYKLKNDESSRLQLLKDLDLNNRKYLFDNGIPTKNFEASYLLQELTGYIKKSAAFIKEVAQGQYHVDWDGLNDENRALNQENLAGELVKTRDQMKKIKREDDQRNWINEGLGQLGDLLRKNNDLGLLSDSILTSVVKYVGANQGAIFLVNDDDENNRFLEMKSAYAFERKKFINKQIQPGEGLAGQAWMEGESIYLKEIPQDYIQIRSGLGGANPNNILISPLKNEEKVLGVLELVSFKVFKKHEIDFIEKITESIASTFSNIKINEKTKILLEQSQQQSEEMRAQEEEMRQNLEELEATQEEMRRKEQQYMAEIDELKEKLEKK